MGKLKKSTLCGAVVAAALFTPVPAIADVAPQARHLLQRAAHAAEAPRLSAAVTAPTSETPTARTAVAQPAVAAQPRQPAPDLALSLISVGTIGLGLSLGGLVIVAARRRQY